MIEIGSDVIFLESKTHKSGNTSVQIGRAYQFDWPVLLTDLDPITNEITDQAFTWVPISYLVPKPGKTTGHQTVYLTPALIEKKLGLYQIRQANLSIAKSSVKIARLSSVPDEHAVYNVIRSAGGRTRRRHLALALGVTPDKLTGPLAKLRKGNRIRYEGFGRSSEIIAA
jgi:hypothetical protein